MRVESPRIASVAARQPDRHHPFGGSARVGATRKAQAGSSMEDGRKPEGFVVTVGRTADCA
jgi:hypothetical protein